MKEKIEKINDMPDDNENQGLAEVTSEDAGKVAGGTASGGGATMIKKAKPGYDQVQYECPNCHFKKTSDPFTSDLHVGENHFDERNTCDNCGKQYHSVFTIVYQSAILPNTVRGYSELI